MASGPWYIVVGYDRPDFPLLDGSAESELNEAHWGYIDQAGDLLARGPLLSSVHDGHAGSIHVIAAPDRAAAEQFAFHEPYYLAGLFATVDVYGFESWLDDSMWERPGRQSPTSWFVRISFGGQRPDAARAPIEVPDSALCAGWMMSESPHSVAGVALLVDGLKSEIEALTSELVAHLSVAPVEVSIIPWRRGGRTV